MIHLLRSIIVCWACLLTCVVSRAQPVVLDTSVVTAAGDTCAFKFQIPSTYNPEYPPALIVGWHALGGTQREIFDHMWDELCEERGWLITSHMGPNDRHWNTRLAQLHCRAMLEWLEANFPFSRDSIYMCGGSMGGAAGQVWHNNNCAYDDYLIAATCGGSQILDCELRQEQYLASGDTNFSMRVAFGGFPFDSDSVAYEYHRYSAVYFEDTTESRHFNALTIPVWSNWGAEEFEWNAYGYAAQDYAMLRRFGAESHFGPAGFNGHGFWVLPNVEVVQWFSGYSVNRFPDTLQLSADEDGRYFYCDVLLGEQPYTFARWDVRKDPDTKRLDIALLRNVAELTVNMVFPWPTLDTLFCHWSLEDSLRDSATIRLAGIAAPQTVLVNGTPWSRVGEDGVAVIPISSEHEFIITFDGYTPAEPAPIPSRIELVRAYPNPFNSSLTIVIASNHTCHTTLRFYDLQGRLAHSEPVTLDPGQRRVNVTLDDLASGIYFARVEESLPLKLLLVR